MNATKFSFSSLISLLLACNIIVSAQATREQILKRETYVYFNDTLFENAKPIALLKKFALPNLINYNYKVLSLQNEGLLFFKYGLVEKTKPYYEVTFLKSNNKAEISFMNQTDIARLIGKYKLIDGGKIEPEAEKFFLLKHKPKTIVVDGTTYIMEEDPKDRDRRQPLTIENETIKQSGKTIGRVTEQNVNLNGAMYKWYNIYNHKNIKIAEARHPIQDNALCNITVYPKRTVKKITVGKTNPKFEVVNYLSSHYYL